MATFGSIYKSEIVKKEVSPRINPNRELLITTPTNVSQAQQLLTTTPTTAEDSSEAILHRHYFTTLHTMGLSRNDSC